MTGASPGTMKFACRLRRPSGLKGEQATYAIDRFHETVAIAVLDDFDISVFSDRGVEVFEDDPEEA